MHPSKLISDIISGFIIRRRWIIIIVCLIMGSGSGLLIPFSDTDPEIRNYVPASMQSRIETDQIENEFGVQDIVIIIFTDSCILEKENLERIKVIDKDISRLSGVSSRISPFTVRSIKSEEGMMIADRLIKRLPSDIDIKTLGEEILSNRFAKDIVISSDLTSAAITAYIDKDQSETEILARIDSVIASHPGKSRIVTGGLPYIRKYIMKDVRRDALFLVPLALLIMLMMLKLTLKKWPAVLMPFSVVLISAMISMGLLPLFGWKMSIMTLLVPIIMISIANNYGIYLTARHQEIQLNEPGITKGDIIKKLLRSLNMPILFSGLTTIAGILGLLTHSIIPARQVGVLAAIGVFMALAMSLLYIPALLYNKGESLGLTLRASRSTRVFEVLLNGISSIITRFPGRILIISAIITLILSSGIFFLRIDTNQENYFPKKHPIKLSSDAINQKFGGSQTISIMISGDIKDPEVMNGIDMLTSKLEMQEGVGQVFSISQALREMSKAVYFKGEAGYNSIPASREAIAQLFELYYMSGEPDDFKQLINPDNSKAHMLIKLSDASNKIIREVKSQIDNISEFIPAELKVGGYAIIMDDFAGAIMRGQASSLLLALFTVFILLSIIFRSFKGGSISSVPLATSIIILFGFMGITGIALDAATALLSSIMIGVGVDFTIQYIWCFNLSLRQGLSYPEATKTAIKTIGRSIIINAISVMAGFSALMFSGFTSIRFFGYLVFISIGSCLLGAIFIIPALILKFRPGFVENDLQKLIPLKYEKEITTIDVDVADTGLSGSSPVA